MKSRYAHALGPLLKKPLFSAEDALHAGIQRHALFYFLDKGIIERVTRGLYRKAGYETQTPLTQEGLAFSAYSTRNGVICMISALDLYGLTDEIPREHWIAIPNSQRAVANHNIRSVRMRNMTLGRTTIELGEYRLAIFNRERCIVDAFRYLSIEIALKSLRAYLEDSSHRPNLRKLQRYAHELRTNLSPYIQALTV